MTDEQELMAMGEELAPRPRGADLSKALLERAPTMLPPGDPVQQINEIVERPDFEGYLQSLDAHTLFRLIKTAGWDQGEDLVPYATPRQIQCFVDFDVWRRDQLITSRLVPWLGTLVEHASDAKLQRVMRGLDPEVIALLFHEHLLVDLIDEEGMIPEHMPDHTERSPDGVFALAYPEDEEVATLLRSLLARLYQFDMALAWTLLEATRWELRSEMEEYAYRWRSSRLEEFGFLPRDEAMAIYRLIEPERLRALIEDDALETPALYQPETLDLPSILTSELTDEFWVLRLLDQLTDDALVRARLFELTAVTNRTLVADGIEPGELESGREVVRRTFGYMSLGLEFLSRADEGRALAILAERPLAELFRVGWSLVFKLHRQALKLESSPTLTLLDGERYSLLDANDAALFEELSRQRPTFAADAITFDIFKRQEQVDRAALTLGQVAFKQLWLFVLMGMAPQVIGDMLASGALLNDPTELTFDTLFSTWIATHLTSGRAAIRGLTRDEVAALLPLVAARPWHGDTATYLRDLLAPIAALIPTASPRLITDWATQSLERLHDELGRMQRGADPRYITGLVLIAKG